MAKKIVSFSIDEEVMKKFKASCAYDGMSMSTLIELMMQAWLDGKIKMCVEGEVENC